MQHDVSDEILAGEATLGNDASFELLVRRLQTPLLHFLRRRVRSLEDAEELVQDAFVRAFQNLHRYDPKWRFRTWLFTIAARLGRDRSRTKRAPHEPTALETLIDHSADPAEKLAQRESQGLLWRQVADLLNPRQLDAVWLFYVEQMSVEEIASVLDGSRVGVRALLFRARRKLLKTLQPNLSSELQLGKEPAFPATKVSHA